MVDPVAGVPARAQSMDIEYEDAGTGEQIKLLGLWVDSGRYGVGEQVPVTLYLTADAPLHHDYQLFIQEIKFPNWLRVDSTEELEYNLIGVTVVVLAVNFMGAVFIGDTENLLQYGAGIALPIAALGLYIGLRTWSGKIEHGTDRTPAVNKTAEGLPAE